MPEPKTEPHQPTDAAPPGSWPRARAAAHRLLTPVEKFLSIEASSGILLLAAAVFGLVWANSPWRSAYDAVLHTDVGIRFGWLVFERTLRFWINDGLMAVFFFVVGLEIKRELYGGALSEIRRAALPVFAAIGGMLVPAGIYLLLNAGTPFAAGWGVPMATDIAFAIGALALLGRRVPPSLRILLLTLAVIDDLGSIIVIALFYSPGISVGGLAVAAGGLFVIVLMQKFGFRSPWAYVPPAIVTWAGTYASGVHPTIAGVAVGLLTPVKAWLGPEAISPAERLEHVLHRPVAFLVMPIFALANAGVTFGTVRLGGGGHAVLLGVVLGLVVGKPIGVIGLSWLAVRARLAALPADVRWSGVLVVGLVAGIGFTMALFIASLAFPEGPTGDLTKLGVLAASTLAALIGSVSGWFVLSSTTAQPQGAVSTQRPTGITVLALFSFLAGIVSITSAVSLLAPGSWLEPMWSINPRARASFASMGPWAAVALVLVSVACVTAAIGLWRRRLWGYRLAIAALAINCAGDLINGLARDPRSLIGVPVVLALLVYLRRPAIRACFRRHRD